MTTRLSELNAMDLDMILTTFPRYADMSPAERKTFLKVAHELHEIGADGYLIHIKWAPNEKVAAIKAYRAWSGQGLKEAKDFIESNLPIGPLNQYQAEECVKIFEENKVLAQVEVA